jgi:hypothetical protein
MLYSRLRTLVLSSLVLGLAVSLRAQSLNVTRTVPNPIANFDISYIDITGRGAGPMLFTLQILPAGATPTERFYILFEATCKTATVEGLLLRARSGDFAIPAGGLTLTSNEFFTDHGDSTASLDITQERLAPGSQEVVLTSGQIPAGRVTLGFGLHRASDGTLVDTAHTWFDIVAVRFINLVTPGVDASSATANVSETFTPYPQFVWSSDLLPVQYPSGTVKFVISVYENPDNAYAPSDIPQSRPVWRDTVPGQSSVNYAQYPVSGSRELKVGGTYYWQVEAVLLGPVSKVQTSKLYVFKVANLAVSGSLTPTQKLILKYLEIILGGNYAYVMRDLRTMVPEELVLADGKRIGVEELAQLAEAFILGKRAVQHVAIE